MSDHDGHTIDVGVPYRVGTAPINLDAILATEMSSFGTVRALCEEVERLRDLLARALPWIDPNDNHDDYLLVVAIEEALPS